MKLLDFLQFNLMNPMLPNYFFIGLGLGDSFAKMTILSDLEIFGLKVIIVPPKVLDSIYI